MQGTGTSISSPPSFSFFLSFEFITTGSNDFSRILQYTYTFYVYIYNKKFEFHFRYNWNVTIVIIMLFTEEKKILRLFLKKKNDTPFIQPKDNP